MTEQEEGEKGERRGINSWCLTPRGSLNGMRGQRGGTELLMCNGPCRCSDPHPHSFSLTTERTQYGVGVFQGQRLHSVNIRSDLLVLLP